MGKKIDYVNGRLVRPYFAFSALCANQRYMELIRLYPDDEMVEFWQSRIKKVEIRQEYMY